MWYLGGWVKEDTVSGFHWPVAFSCQALGSGKNQVSGFQGVLGLRE